MKLYEEITSTIDVPVVAVANKSDIKGLDGYPSMSTGQNSGVDEVLLTLMEYWREPGPVEEPVSYSVTY